MKFSKPPKRRGSPSDAFLSKSRPELLVPPQEGPVRIYLDASRPVPEGWTVARTGQRFIELLKPDEVCDRVTHLSMDWALGTKDPLGGDDLSYWFVQQFEKNEQFLPKLQSIGLHCVNRDRAREMDNILAQGIPSSRRNTFFVQWSTPRLSLTIPPKKLLTK